MTVAAIDVKRLIPELVSAAQARELLDVSLSTLYRWQLDGVIRPAGRVGAGRGMYLYTLGEIERVNREHVRSWRGVANKGKPRPRKK